MGVESGTGRSMARSHRRSTVAMHSRCVVPWPDFRGHRLFSDRSRLLPVFPSGGPPSALPREASSMSAEDVQPPGSARTAPDGASTTGEKHRGESGAEERDARRRLMLSFDAFDASHHRLWLRYAH